jgi:hypothetical protein
MSRSEDGERGDREPIDVEFEPAERRHEGGGVGFGTAFLLALVAAGAGAAGGALAPRVPEVNALLDRAIPDAETSAAAAHYEELSASNALLKQQVDGLNAVMNTPLAEAASAGPEGANVAARVFAIQAGLRDVQTQLQTMPSTSEVAALVAEVQDMQQQLPALAAESRIAAESARAAFAVAAAAEASRSSGPFEQAYSSLQALLPEDENVLALAPLARTGAPTRQELRERFDVIDNDIIRAARIQQAGAGFWGRMQAALADWIVVRRVGQSELDTPDGVVELASQRLDADDLAGAIEALSRLSGPSRQAADRWITNAQRRLEIDQRLAAVRTELSRRS